VLERADELGEIGDGIQIGPNAFHCFDYLGVDPLLPGNIYVVEIESLRKLTTTIGERE